MAMGPSGQAIQGLLSFATEPTSLRSVCVFVLVNAQAPDPQDTVVGKIDNNSDLWCTGGRSLLSSSRSSSHPGIYDAEPGHVRRK